MKLPKWHKKKKPIKPITVAGIDPQDPLPESNWLYRRFVLIGSLIILFILRALEEHAGIINHWTDYLILFILILYTVAPSGEQVAKMFAIVALFSPGRSYTEAFRDRNNTQITEETHTDSVTTTTIEEGELPFEMRVKRDFPYDSY